MLTGYESGSSDTLSDSKLPNSHNVFVRNSVQIAPDVDVSQLVGPKFAKINASAKQIVENPTARDLAYTVSKLLAVDEQSGGFNASQSFFSNQKTLTGACIEEADISGFNFSTQYNNFQSLGFGEAPEGQLIMAGGKNVGWKQRGEAVTKLNKDRFRLRADVWSKHAKDDGRKRVKQDDSTDVDSYLGPWGGFEGEAEAEKIRQVEANERAESEKLKQKLEDESKEAALRMQEEKEVGSTTSEWHGKKPKVDYQGRTWLEARPQLTKRESKKASRVAWIDADAEMKAKPSYLPKKIIYTWQGHEKGIQSIRFFPESHHLILSAGLDSKVKIWDYGNDRQCRMTYSNHSLGVRDIRFLGDGKKFLSASYDGSINCWDTATGKVIRKFKPDGGRAFHLAVNTSDENMFVVALEASRAVQYDLNQEEIVQEYKEHLGHINTVTICDDNKKLVTTSDDRKIFVWPLGVSVVEKYIAEPGAFSVPAVALHPTGRFLACQSMNNVLMVYQCAGGFKFLSRRKFQGFQNAGYSIEPGFSSDGKYIMSGDGGGRVHFWDFKTCKLYRSLPSHTGPCTSSMWHPNSNSRVITAGWDGKMNLLE